MEDRVFENNRLLRTALARVFAEFSLATNGAILVNISYSEDGREDSLYSGLRFVAKRRSAGEVAVVVFYGFDNKKELAKKENGSILKSEGVFYLQMPFDLTKQLGTIRKALRYGGSIQEPLDNTTAKSEILRILRLLNHNLPNLIGTIEPNINCLVNAGAQQLHSEWSIVKEAMLGAKRNRIEKEILILQELGKLIFSDQKIVYDQVRRQLLKADTHYKDMFDVLTDSTGYTELSKNAVIENGQTIVESIKKARMLLERTINETSTR